MVAFQQKIKCSNINFKLYVKISVSRVVVNFYNSINISYVFVIKY